MVAHVNGTDLHYETTGVGCPLFVTCGGLDRVGGCPTATDGVLQPP